MKRLPLHEKQALNVMINNIRELLGMTRIEVLTKNRFRKYSG